MPTRTGSAALQNTVRAELSTLLPLPQPAALLCSPYSLCGPLYVPLYVPLFVPLFCCSCNSPYHPTTLPASALAAGLKRGSAEKPLRRFSAGVRTTHLRRLPASLPPCLSIALPPPAGPSYGPISSSCPICPSARLPCLVSFPDRQSGNLPRSGYHLPFWENTSIGRSGDAPKAAGRNPTRRRARRGQHCSSTAPAHLVCTPEAHTRSSRLLAMYLHHSVTIYSPTGSFTGSPATVQPFLPFPPSTPAVLLPPSRCRL